MIPPDRIRPGGQLPETVLVTDPSFQALDTNHSLWGNGVQDRLSTQPYRMRANRWGRTLEGDRQRDDYGGGAHRPAEILLNMRQREPRQNLRPSWQYKLRPQPAERVRNSRRAAVQQRARSGTR